MELSLVISSTIVSYFLETCGATPMSATIRKFADHSYPGAVTVHTQNQCNCYITLDSQFNVFWTPQWHFSKLQQTNLWMQYKYLLVKSKYNCTYCNITKQTNEWYYIQMIKYISDSSVTGPKILPPFTMKFIRWKTFWVVQPYSGTLNSILINWICTSRTQIHNFRYSFQDFKQISLSLQDKMNHIFPLTSQLESN